eukprot:gene8268-1537_t
MAIALFSFFFPMARLTGDTPINLSVIHESALVKREDFIGQVGSTLSSLLEPMMQMMDPFTRWYRLAGKRTDATVGDLQLSVTVVPKVMHIRAYPLTRDLYNNEKLLEKYRGHSLKVSLIGLKNLKVNSKVFPDPTKNLSVTFKLSRCQVTMKLNPKAVEEGETFSITLDDQVLIPLAATFEGKPTRKIDEVTEVKITLKMGEDTVCRTQVPIWDVPFLLVEEAAGSIAEDEDLLGILPAAIPEEAEQDEVTERAESELGALQKKTSQSSFLGAVGNVTNAVGTVGGSAMKFATDMATRPSATRTHSSGLEETEVKNPVRAGAPGLSRSSAKIFMNSTSRNNGPETLDTLFPTLNSPVEESGRKYKRSMSPSTNDIHGAPELEFYMYIVPKQDEKAVAGEVITLDAEEDDDGETPITPITPPPPLDVLAVSMAVPGKPNAVFSALTDADSEYLKGVMGAEALRDIKISAWESAPSVGPNALTRKVNYVRPLNIPLAPKQCDVEEVHTVKVKEAGGFVLERKVSTNAPKGDSFFVLIEDVGVWDPASKSTTFSTTFKIEIVKSLGMLKGVVMNGATSSTKAGATKWAQELARYMSTRAGGEKSRSVAGAALATGGGFGAAPSPSSGGGLNFPSISFPSLQTIDKVVRMICYLFLALGFYHVARGFAGIGVELVNLLTILVERDYKFVSTGTLSAWQDTCQRTDNVGMGCNCSIEPNFAE